VGFTILLWAGLSIFGAFLLISTFAVIVIRILMVNGLLQELIKVKLGI
jgi:hypothetical protein